MKRSRTASKPAIDRRRALQARPRKLPALRREEREDGGLKITVRLEAPRWFRWLGGQGQVERSFGLDPLGREVYEGCDDDTPVEALAQQFARNHQLSSAEAEMAVAAYLKTLMAKGLVAMEIDKGSKTDD